MTRRPAGGRDAVAQASCARRPTFSPDPSGVESGVKSLADCGAVSPLNSVKIFLVNVHT